MRILPLLLLFALGASDTYGSSEAAKDARPNILFCLADDWSWPHAGAYGDPVVKTPAFDRLAREGVLFEHAYVSSPSCTPSRNALLTGQQFYRLGTGANLYGVLDAGHPNFMLLLRDAGYSIGHWRKAWGPGKFQEGGYREHPCGPETSFAKFMQQRDKTKPFCFWFGTSDPHRSYEEGSGRKKGMEIDRIPVPGFYPKADTIRSDIADYYFEVERWDSDVAQALELLEEAGELDNTIVVMTGDNGMPFPRCKGNLYDSGSRMPLAIRWPKGMQHPGRKISDFVSFTDLAPTFLTAAGVAVPEVMTGRPLVPILRSSQGGRVEISRDHIVYGRERHTDTQAADASGYPARALRTDHYLYIRNYRPDRWPAGTPDYRNAYKENAWLGDCDNSPTKYYLWANRDLDDEHRRCHDLAFAKRPTEELYVLADDPDQLRNVAGNPEYADVKADLAARLTGYLQKTGDPRETGKPVKFDEYPYGGGVPTWPGDEAIRTYKIPPRP
jgi:arylsulfatase A-like enzyme